jgi:hypothetical protein
MLTISAFEMRRRAMRWENSPWKDWVRKQMLKLLLHRAIYQEDPDLVIEIERRYPGRRTAFCEHDRICILHEPSNQRTGIEQRELVRSVALACYGYARGFEQLRPIPVDQLDEAELSNQEQKELVSAAYDIAQNSNIGRIFEDERPPPAPTRRREPVRYGVPV